MRLTRRSLLQAAGILAAPLPLRAARAAGEGQATIAYPVDVPSWDAVAHTFPLAMPIFKSVYDSPLTFTPDLKLAANVMTAWKLGGDGKTIAVRFRDDVHFHNGDRLTAADFRFSFLERQKADPKLPTAGIWRKITDIEITSQTAAVVHLAAPMPTAPQWWAFLGSFILPKKYYEKVGHDGFLAKPVGSGPYRLAEYQRDARIVLEANAQYWGGPPPIGRVTIEVVKDPTARVAAIEAGRVDITKQIAVREALRLDHVPGTSGRVQPITDIVIIQIGNRGAFTDANVRLAAHHAIDKEAISKAFFNGVAKPISVLAPPGTPGDVPGFTFPYSVDEAKSLLAKSGHGPQNPVKIGFNTTNGAFASDFDMARAITAMWQKVGIDADLQVIELAQYYALNHAGKGPEATLYAGWGNDTADPEIYTGYILNPHLQFSTWKSADLGPILDKLFAETDYEKRIAGYRALNRMVIEKGYAMPLLQGVTTVAYRDSIRYTPYGNGWLLPATLERT
jgi:dipeptide transport system substrate-binding protein